MGRITLSTPQGQKITRAQLEADGTLSGVVAADVAAGAGIEESKLALNSPTHAQDHAARHAAGQPDVLTPAAIGASPSGHNHDGSYEAAGAVATHAGAADPHTGYQKETEREAASGYAGLDAGSKVIRDPASATATPTAGKIPIADGSGRLDGWIRDPHPVGSLYLSFVSTNPSSLFGGTWVACGAGRMLVGLDAADPAFDTPEETGGAKTHTHAGHAAHVFTQPSGHSNHIFTQPSGHSNHIVTQPTAHGTLAHTSGADSSTTGGVAKATAATVHTLTNNHAGAAVDAHSAHAGGAVDAHSAHAGGAVDAHSAHDSPSHLPPYIVVYMFKRTA